MIRRWVIDCGLLMVFLVPLRMSPLSKLVVPGSTINNPPFYHIFFIIFVLLWKVYHLVCPIMNLYSIICFCINWVASHIIYINLMDDYLLLCSYIVGCKLSGESCTLECSPDPDQQKKILKALTKRQLKILDLTFLVS